MTNTPTEEREADWLLTTLDEWEQFAAHAARIRLERLQFAVDAEGRVLIRGRPLPPLPGGRFALHGRVAVPSGFAWQPAVSADVLMRRLGVAGDANYVLKVRTRTTAELEDLIRRLREQAGVATRTTIALSIPFEGRPLHP